MADEIIKLGGNGINREFLFLYPIVPKITYSGNAGASSDLAPTPSSGLPALADEILSTPEKNDLDSGDSGFQVVYMRFNDADMANDAVLIPSLQAEYASKKTEFLTRVNMEYSRTGSKFDGVA